MSKNARREPRRAHEHDRVRVNEKNGSWFDHVVVNEEVEAASAEVAAIIGAFPQVSDHMANDHEAKDQTEGPKHP
mgnify:CR=1 FL=1